MSVFDHKEFDNHEHVAFCHDEKTGLRAIIAVHNTNLGPSLGGCRMWPYATSEDALYDVLRLSKGMTYKSAMANLKLGGGKAVIIGNARTEKTEDLMRAMGDFVNTVGGKYISAEDSGTSVSDLKVMGERTEFVAGVKNTFKYDGSPSDGNPSPSTAYGVFVGLKASAERKFGKGLDGMTVAVQGLGAVGYNLAELLHAEGAKLVVADIYEDSLAKAESELNATIVSPDEILGQNVDVFAPCALGAIINDISLKDLKAPVIAGAANNVLADPHHGEELRKRGVLYAPDYVINAGGIIDVYYQRVGGTAPQLREHIESIADNLNQIFDRSDAEEQPTNLVADVIAEERFKF